MSLKIEFGCSGMFRSEMADTPEIVLGLRGFDSSLGLFHAQYSGRHSPYTNGSESMGLSSHHSAQ